MKKWIYQQDSWSNFTWDEEVLSQKLSNVRYKQGRLLGQILAMGLELKTSASIKILTTDIVKSSAIEGEILDTDEVRSSIVRRLGLEEAGLVKASRDVEGIVEMMLDATQNYKQPLTKERLCAWQATLFPTGRSGMSFIAVGDFRADYEGPMQVISGPMGRERVHFEAPPAKSLDTELDKFLAWFEQSKNIDPVLKSGIAHFWFVTLHPFEDGNGRIARAIADLALARADDMPARYYSVSTQISADRKSYYKTLMLQQRSDTCDITLWLDWYLDCMDRAIDNSKDILHNIYYKDKLWHKLSDLDINQRQKAIISKMLDDFKGYINTSKYAKLSKCSTDTALRDIQSLNKQGILVKNPAGGRSTSYRLITFEEI